MKYFSKLFLLFSIVILSSCEDTNGKIPMITFKTEDGYIHSNEDVLPGKAIKFGINAVKSDTRSYLDKFVISKSINFGKREEVFSKEISRKERDNYMYDFEETSSTVSGQKVTYYFTIYDKNSLSNEVFTTLTIQ